MWHNSINNTTISPLVHGYLSGCTDVCPEFESNAIDYYMSLYLDRKKQKFLVFINSKNEKISFLSKKWKNFYPFVKDHIERKKTYYMEILAHNPSIKVENIDFELFSPC